MSLHPAIVDALDHHADATARNGRALEIEDALEKRYADYLGTDTELTWRWDDRGNPTEEDDDDATPPHGCWQCKALFDELPADERVQLFWAMGTGEYRTRWEKRLRGQRWVDARFAEEHADHQPETWV